MPRKILIILFLFLFNFLFAQEWSEPVNISNMDGLDSWPDMAIDSSGVIHCVWKHTVENDHVKIYYSKSEDDGESWTTPEDVSKNNEKKCSTARIAIDSENSIYITYDYNTGNYYETLVHLRKFDGVSWSDSIVISEGYPGASKNRMTIDNNNRVYVFWASNLKIYYRYLENDILSDIICPYYDDNDWYFLQKALADKENNLHCVGAYYADTSTDDNVTYFKYDYISNTWQNFEILNIDNPWSGSDIDLDKNQNPHIVWHEETNPYPNFNDATLYAYFNGTTWSEPEMIVEDPVNQLIKIVNDKVYLLDLEKDGDSSNVVIYKKDNFENWFGKIIYTSELGGHTDLEKYKRKLYLLLQDVITQDNSEIYLMKSDVSTNITENHIESPLKLYSNHPNPFSEYTQINYSVNTNGHTSLKIYNLKGQLIRILVNENKQKGNYSVTWDGTDQKGNKVTAGIYLYRLLVDKYCMTRSLIITN